MRGPSPTDPLHTRGIALLVFGAGIFTWDEALMPPVVAHGCARELWIEGESYGENERTVWFRQWVGTFLFA